MNKKNIVEFNVGETGRFTALKEAPAHALFNDRRNELAKLCGGKVELIKMESALRLYKKSKDPYERNVADCVAYELIRMDKMLTIKTVLVATPNGFDIDALNMNEFDMLWMAYEVAIGNFRQADDSAAASKTDEVAEA